MKTARLLCSLVFLAAMPVSVFAQTNSDVAPNAPAAAAPAGPVVMPPPDQAPPAPPADQPATPAVPALDQSAPPADASSPAAPVPGTVVNPPTSSNPGQDEIADIRPPLFFLFAWWPWILLALAVLAFLGLVWLVWKWAARRGVMSPKNAYDLALEKLEKARALMREDDPAPYAIAVSETIRTYLGQRFHSPSDRRTTEEFLRQMQQDTTTPLADHAELLGAFLRACDLVKFARYQPTLAELEEVQQRAVNFVTATKPVPADGHARAPLTPAAATS
jgi:uncharacterized protein DUF4381